MDHRLIATLLLSVFSFVLVMGGFSVYMVLRWRHLRGSHIPQGIIKVPPLQSESPPGFRHFALKRPNCWLAIKNRNLLAVQSALAVHNAKPCSCLEGLSGDGEQKLFISPPISGWILVIGSALPDPCEDVDACFRFLLEVSRKLGHVQFFFANAMLNYHAWAQADGGHINRGYAWAGRTLWTQGAMTSAESDLGMRCFDYSDPADVPTFSAPDASCNNSDKVHLLAARWSVDPEDLDERLIEHEWGIVGEPSRLF
ncbi:MAG TPA: hypothetical protein VG754_03910 [Verrucomicrobiae bacterium]|nr:hypothetical protein [Verrucomicrobiae bacterium]